MEDTGRLNLLPEHHDLRPENTHVRVTARSQTVRFPSKLVETGHRFRGGAKTIQVSPDEPFEGDVDQHVLDFLKHHPDLTVVES